MEQNPLEQFRNWFDQARAAGLLQPEAMALATATLAGRPSARMVLLKGLDDRGFLFYTNYESRKSLEMAENPRAAVVLYWFQLHRQVRIEGKIEQLTDRESDAYFATRPLGSRLAAWASDQSRVIESRDVLERRVQELEDRYADEDVPRPDYWGGYRLCPDSIEFWQGRLDRLHDRLRYSRSGDAWLIERLAP